MPFDSEKNQLTVALENAEANMTNLSALKMNLTLPEPNQSVIGYQMLNSLNRQNALDSEKFTKAIEAFDLQGTKFAGQDNAALIDGLREFLNADDTDKQKLLTDKTKDLDKLFEEHNSSSGSRYYSFKPKPKPNPNPDVGETFFPADETVIRTLEEFNNALIELAERLVEHYTGAKPLPETETNDPATRPIAERLGVAANSLEQLIRNERMGGYLGETYLKEIFASMNPVIELTPINYLQSQHLAAEARGLDDYVPKKAADNAYRGKVPGQDPFDIKMTPPSGRGG